MSVAFLDSAARAAMSQVGIAVSVAAPAWVSVLVRWPLLLSVSYYRPHTPAVAAGVTIRAAGSVVKLRNMRVPVLTFLVCACLFAQSDDSPEIARAKANIEKLRVLVEAGAAPRKQLDKA